MFFQALVLVCSINTPTQECNEITSLQTFQSAMFENELLCKKYEAETQETMARTALKFDPVKEYVKTGCHRIKTT